jgi:hypothetical protein
MTKSASRQAGVAHKCFRTPVVNDRIPHEMPDQMPPLRSHGPTHLDHLLLLPHTGSGSGRVEGCDGVMQGVLLCIMK